ncbi:MAG: hypothetical protein GHHEDOFH_00839 [Pseudorhodoplanes sp.]|nr:hypothetical protein [Pseudorhodoplanes sp.]
MTNSVSNSLSTVLISLMKGIVDRENDPLVWQSLLNLQARIRDYVDVLGLELILDEAEGYAYLRQHTMQIDGAELPRLVPRHRLGYQVSLLLVLLRKKLAEFDAISGESRLVLTRDAIVEMIRLFLPDTANQARLMERVDTHINRTIEMGFLRRLRGTDDLFEVRRILKAFVDGQWLADFDQRLAEYRTYDAAQERERSSAHGPN